MNKIYVITYSSIKEGDKIPYVECKGVYTNEDTAEEALRDEYDILMDVIYEDYNILDDFEIEHKDKYWSVHNLRDKCTAVCCIQEKEIN